jgi:hypothetical protein
MDFGVVEINLDFSRGTAVDNGNLLGLVGSYTSADGSSHDMADVWFAKQADMAPTAAELLAGPAPDLLAATGAAPVVPDVQAASIMVPLGTAARHAADDDWLRSQTLLL